jgi:hypothetical protein
LQGGTRTAERLVPALSNGGRGYLSGRDSTDRERTVVPLAANKTKRNDTLNTPKVSESKIARMKADDLRRELKNRGVKGTLDLKKADLVKKQRSNFFKLENPDE